MYFKSGKCYKHRYFVDAYFLVLISNKTLFGNYEMKVVWYNISGHYYNPVDYIVVKRKDINQYMEVR